MKRILALAVISFALAACDQEQENVTQPPPHDLTPDAIGYFCGMNVQEHPGPKGQIILASRSDPVWFSSARDALGFTLLPGNPRTSRPSTSPTWARRQAGTSLAQPTGLKLIARSSSSAVA